MFKSRTRFYFESRCNDANVKRPCPVDRLVTARLTGKRIELSVDENDHVSVSVFRETEPVELDMDAVMRALEESD